MERDPVRFVWRSASALNICLALLAAVAILGLWVALDLVRAAIDDAALGRAFADRATAPFGRVALVLPGRLADEPIVLLSGWPLARPAMAQALGGAVLAAALAAGLLLAGSSLVRAEIARRSLAAIEARLLEAIASAPSSAAAGAHRAALLASDSLTGLRPFLGRAIGTPSLAGALLFAASSFLALLNGWIAGLAALGFAAFGLANRARISICARVDAADDAANTVLRRSLTDLAEHLSAVAAHGTASQEQRRLSADMNPIRLPGRLLRQQAVLAQALTATIALATPAGVLGLGVWLGLGGRLSPGEVAAAAVAAAIGLGSVERLQRWRGERKAAAPVLGEVARELGTFNARRRDVVPATLPASGVLGAEHVTVDGTLRGGRLTGLDLSFRLPSHVALTGDSDSGARTFAGLLGAQVESRAGYVTLDGVRIADADPAERAKRLAFAGGETLLLANTLRANILYGCPDPDAPDIEGRLASALAVAGLKGFVYRRGLAGSIDPRREPGLAAAIVAARAGVRAELDGAGLTCLVQPFDPARYNPHATIGENILFGVSLGDTFREENLATNPFMRGLLDREDLARTLAELGAGIVRNTVEMFWGLPSRSAIVGRFSLLSAAEQEEFGAVVARFSAGSARNAGSGRDMARLIGLALRYSETRHRLGLLVPELEERLLRVRAAFSRDIPKSLEPSIEFFRPDRLCAATSVLDNLLFGRVAEDQAAARTQVLAVIRTVLDRLDLAADIIRTGLQTRIDPVASGLSPSRTAAVDLARCLVREPDNLVVERALDELPAPEALATVRRLTEAMKGRGLVVVVPPQLSGAAEFFDTTLVFKAGKAVPSATAPAEPAGSAA